MSEVVEVLNSLTGRSDLVNLTLLNWNRLVSPRDLQRARRAWCPNCLDHFINECNVVYEPLLWSLQAIGICPVHGVKLLEICRHCNRTSPPLARKSITGHCCHCHGWLGDSTKLKQSLSSFEEFRLTEAKRLIQICQSGQWDLDMQALVNKLMSNFPEMTLTSLAKQIGFPKITLWDWARRNVKPSFNNLTEFCYRLNISVSSLIEQSWQPKLITLRGDLDVKTERRNTRFVDWDHVRKELEEILNDPSETVSMAEVARRLGYAKRLLYEHWPEQCKAIAKRNTDKVKGLRKNNVQLVRSEVKAIGEHLIVSGQYPSRRRIEAMSSKPAILRSFHAKQEWADLLKLSSLTRTNQEN